MSNKQHELVGASTADSSPLRLQLLHRCAEQVRDYERFQQLADEDNAV